jgi:hypothetical protein
MVQTAENFTRTCAVYVSRTDDVALIAAMLNHAGAYTEMPGGVAVVRATDFDAVGRAVQEKLDACRFEPRFDHRGRKKTDWPAYLASGMRSTTAFERRFVRLSVAGLHGETRQWKALSPEFFNGACLHALSSWSGPAEERGEWLITLARFFIEVEKKTESP